MPHRSSRSRTTPAKLTFVVIPGPDKPSRTFEASKLKIAVIVLSICVAVGGISVILMVNTPLGKLFFPDFFSTQKEQLEKVQALRQRVDAVQRELAYLASYNDRLRSVLGDTSISDTTESPTSEKSVTRAEIQPPKTEAPRVLTDVAVVSSRAQSPELSSVSVAGDATSMFPLMMPVSGFITRGVDYAIQHYGIDIAASVGEPIVAPAPGEVVFADWTMTGGNTLIIVHAGNFITVYKHCERILVSVGTKVARGEAVALVGSTGTTSTGPHLHFELWHNGKILNPEDYLLKTN